MQPPKHLPLKVLGLISSYTDPASRFRILQYKKHLQYLGTDLSCVVPRPLKESGPSRLVFRSKKLWHICQTLGRRKLLTQQHAYDLIWQNRLLLSGHYGIEKKFTRPHVFDFDDAVWLTEGKKQVDTAITKASLVVAGNEYLADYADKLNKNTVIVPSVVDLAVFTPLAVRQLFFTAGWIGSKSNLGYLRLIKEPLLQFLKETTGTRLMIVSDVKPSFFHFDDDRIIFRQWTAEKENELINTFSAGLMPLPDNEWTKGKCGFKLLQYMACCKPVIASPVGVNAGILSASGAGLSATGESDWLNALHELKSNTSLYRSFAEKARPFIDQNYSCSKWAATINSYFSALL